MGNKHRYYLHISSEIVNTALSYLIDEVNAAQEEGFPKLKNVLIEAWRAQLYMDKFDLDSEFKQGCYKNIRDSLYGIIKKNKGFEWPIFSSKYKYGCGWCFSLKVDDIDLRTAEELYQSAKTIAELEKFIQKYPHSQYVAQAKKKISEIKFKACRTIDDFKKFIYDYPNTTLASKAQAKLKKLFEDEKKLSICKTTDEVIALYRLEKELGINLDLCSIRAYELAKKNCDYSKIIDIFGGDSIGGKKASVEMGRRERARKDLLKEWGKVLFWIAISLLPLFGIYLLISSIGFAKFGLALLGIVILFLINLTNGNDEGFIAGCVVRLLGMILFFIILVLFNL